MSSQLNNDYIQVATIGKTVGLKGELKLHLQTDFPEQFKTGKTFKTKTSQLTIDSFNKKRLLVKFKGYDTPEIAKKLTNQKLYTTVEQTKKDCTLKEGEFFWFDIQGCEIIEDGIKLGKVVDIDRILDTDYLKIQTDVNLTEKKLPKSFLLPYNDRYIVEVDINNKTIKTKQAYNILQAS